MSVQSHPNVVFIVGDNAGWGDISCYGGIAPTPRIDALAGLWPEDRGPRLPPGIPRGKARAIAQRAHRGQVEPSGRPYVHHLRRVVAAVPPEAAGVAWLHDVLERTDVREEDLLAAGLGPEECAALRLLTRSGDPDDEGFVSHVRVIALTPGPAGDIARVVKRADMEDRLRLPRDPEGAWMPPYRRALEILAMGSPDRGTRPQGWHRPELPNVASGSDDSKGVPT